MHLYRFFNPSAVEADKSVLIVSANHWDAIHAYVQRYHPFFRALLVSKDFNSDKAILLEESYKKLEDGRVMFYELFAIKIS